MDAFYRRRKIMKYLYENKNDTISNIANRFCVSKRTIQRDIEVLSLYEPIYTRSGRYGGGVYVMEDYYISNKLMLNQRDDQ